MKIFLFLIITPLFIMAQVNILVPKTFVIGEGVTFNISVSGDDVEFPNILDIEGFVVQKAGTSSQTTIINSRRKQKITKSYIFYPTSNITIPSFKVKIDGKIEETKAQNIFVKKVSKTKSNMFDLIIEVDKTDVYVGEELVLTMTFKYKKDLTIYDLKFTQPSFDNFWSKPLQGDKQVQDNLYIVQKLKFLLFAQKAGTLDINRLNIDVVVPDLNARNTFFGQATKSKKIYSNNLKINVKPLPQNINLIGDFTIKTKIDKNTVNFGEAVSFQLEIEGRGNIDDLEEYKLNIPNATIYDNPSEKNFNIKNNQYGGIYKKSYSIVADSDFTIPVITLKYFDKQQQKIKTVKSQQYKIKVNGVKVEKQKLNVQDIKVGELNQKVETKTVTKVIETSDNEKIIYYILGFISALIIFIIYIILNNRKRKQEDIPLFKSIKKCATQNELLKKLSPYINIEENLDKIIYELDSSNKVDLKQIKKQILIIIKELKL